jgi:8-oxo-dGTP diphosphatase
MIKKLPYSWKLVIASLFFSYLVIALAGFLETLVQGPLNVPGDIDFTAYIPGKYTLYRECPSVNDNESALNEILACTVHGNGHLSPLIATAQYTGAMSHHLTDPQSGKSLIGIPFVDFEILWPGSYHLHVEYTLPVEKHPNILVGIKDLVTVAAIFSLALLSGVLYNIIKHSKVFKKQAPAKEDSVNFVLLPPNYQPAKISSVFVIPFMPDGRMVAISTNQGPDIPGGPVQTDKTNCEKIALEKAEKEIAASLQTLKPVRIIQSDYYGPESESLLYGIVFTALVDSLHDMPADGPDRLLLEADDFLDLYNQPFKEQMEVLVSEAYDYCFSDQRQNVRVETY